MKSRRRIHTEKKEIFIVVLVFLIFEFAIHSQEEMNDQDLLKGNCDDALEQKQTKKDAESKSKQNKEPDEQE